MNAAAALLATLAVISIGVYADIPTGIIGGETEDSAAYAALVFSPDTASSISGLPGTMSNIYGVAINASGVGIVGGQGADGNGYAATVSPGGTVAQIPISFPGGTIFAVAINQSGAGLIGGFQGSVGDGLYAATISPDGVANPFSSGCKIVSVAFNDDELGLIGGEGLAGMTGGQGYAAYVIDGALGPVFAPFPSDDGKFFCAINQQGNGIIGGYVIGMTVNGYAAFVTPAGDSFPVTLTDVSSLASVAINNSGLGLVGGADNSSNAYAAYVTLDAAPTPVLGDSFSGLINSVAINDSGAGIIGGYSGSTNLYAALISLKGNPLVLFPDPIAGEINSVAINQAGVGLIGGLIGSNGYAALVAPNGILTPLDVSSESDINSVALSIQSGVVPTSAGAHLSVVYTQLAANYALQSRFAEQNKMWTSAKNSEVTLADIVDSDTNLAFNQTDLPSTPEKPLKKNSIWIAPFGNYVHLKEQGSIPSYTNEIGGGLLSYDHRESNYMLGGSLGYAFNYVGYSGSIGHGKIQEEMACFYGAYFIDHFRLNGALWGGLYQFWNTRHTLSLFTSEGFTQGWILSPHLEMASPWNMDRKGLYQVEPYFMLDWVNSWQKKFTETGPSGFNLNMPSIYGSLLQSEVGLRFYERFKYGWGDFCLEEKLSYVNQAPFNFNTATTSFVASASTFPIAVASTKVQNLGAIELSGSFVPQNDAYPFGGFSLETIANGSYQSYFISLFGGVRF